MNSLLVTLLISYSLASPYSNADCDSAYCSACSNKQCSSCIDNYVLVDGKCVYVRDAIPHCYKAKNGVCEKCFDGYHFDGSECVVDDPTCDEYNERTGRCEECEDGYTLDGTTGKCIECSVPGCEECERGPDTCTECLDGYVFQNGKCEQPVPNCDDYENGRCEECIDGYYLKDQQCLKISDDNCRRYDENGVCVQCFGPYKPVNGVCTSSEAQVIEHCIEYDDDEFECEECEVGYAVDKSEKNCIKCDAKCKTCEDYPTKCETCNEGYYMDDDNCIECKSVKQECSSYTSEKFCHSCNNACGWDKTNHKCVEAHCLVFDEDDDEEDIECELCEDGYQLEEKGHFCIKGDGCLKKDAQTNKCILCSDGYFMKEDFTCGKCNTECRTCANRADSCHSCVGSSDGKSKVTCTSCSDLNCLECDENPMKCTLCRGNYTASVETGECIMGCYKEDIEEKCTMCSDRENEMNIYYPPTEEGVCLKYSEMPNIPNPPSPNPDSDNSEPDNSESGATSLYVLFLSMIVFIL